VEVEDRAVLGAYAGVHQFCRIGTLAMLGAGAMVGRDVTPYTIVHGYPAAPVSTNVLGLKRAGIPAERRDAVKRLYKIFFRSGLSTDKAVEAAREVPPCEERDRFLEFVARSKRGVCK
jgi:UDP-N-acetylglucosamine acyltransferase